MTCCLASSRERMMIWLGVPISPERSRRTSFFPIDPVPPVIRIRLPSRITSPAPFDESLPPARPASGPSRHPVGGARLETRRVEAAVAREGVVGRDLHVACAQAREQHREQRELVHWGSGEVPHTGEPGVPDQEVLDGPGHLDRGEAAVDGAAEALDPAALGQEPLDEPAPVRRVRAR